MPNLSDLEAARCQVQGEERPYDPNRVMPRQCATCPWRQDENALVIPEWLAVELMTNPNAHNQNCHAPAWSGQPEDTVCRGHRDHWAAFFHSEGVLRDRSDEAWAETLRMVKGDG